MYCWRCCLLFTRFLCARLPLVSISKLVLYNNVQCGKLYYAKATKKGRRSCQVDRALFLFLRHHNYLVTKCVDFYNKNFFSFIFSFSIRCDWIRNCTHIYTHNAYISIFIIIIFIKFIKETEATKANRIKCMRVRLSFFFALSSMRNANK